MFQTKTTVFDVIAVAAVLLIAVLLTVLPFLTAAGGEYLAVITPDGEQLYRLDEPQTLILESNGIILTVTIENGSARVIHSDCPDGICISSGAISRKGETVLCAPAGVTLTVKGGDGNVDFVAG